MGPEARAVAEASGLRDIVFGMDFGTRALGHLARWSARLAEGPVPDSPRMMPAIWQRFEGERALLDFLATQRVPVVPGTITRSAPEAAAAAKRLDGPVAMKIASPDIAHKSEAGGVRLGIAAVDAARTYDEIRAAVARALPAARIDGIIVSPMRTDGLELFVGVARDSDWGLAIAVGLGGVWVEILKDSAVRLLPVGKTEVREMLASLRGAALLGGYRGGAAADLDRLAEAIVAIGDAALALGPDLAALEINPLWVRGGDVQALDALAVWQG